MSAARLEYDLFTFRRVALRARLEKHTHAHMRAHPRAGANTTRPVNINPATLFALADSRPAGRARGTQGHSTAR